MKTDDLYEFFGSLKNILSAIGVSSALFYYWVKQDNIPIKNQKIIESLTKGKLKADSYKYYPQEKDSDIIYLPRFRYYDKKYGMCEVELIRFKEGKKPKIVYLKKGVKTEKFCSFITDNLMQAVDVLDSS